MSARGRDVVVRRMVEEARFVTYLGIAVTGSGPGWCETTLDEPRPELLQQSGSLHAGVMTTLADHTAGAAIVSLLADGLGVVSVDLSISFLRPANGSLRCRAESLRCGKRIGVAEATVYGRNDEGEERAVAKAKVTLAVVPWSPSP
jgi:uncharacterized protein (TIGR00369 family)